MRKIMLVLSGAAIAIAVITVPLASGSPIPGGCTKDRGTISCVPPPQTGVPHRNFTTQETTTVKGNFDSSHDPLETGTATNHGGGVPPGQQQP